MATCIRKAVSEDQVRLIRAITATGSYGPGSVTAVGPTASIKHNLQLATGSDAANRAAEVLVAALRESGGFFAATWLDAMTAPLFCRYEPGMTYGDHVDAAMMGAPPMQMRCDVAVTVWLIDATAYDGGELIIDSRRRRRPVVEGERRRLPHLRRRHDSPRGAGVARRARGGGVLGPDDGPR